MFNKLDLIIDHRIRKLKLPLLFLFPFIIDFLFRYLVHFFRLNDFPNIIKIKFDFLILMVSIRQKFFYHFKFVIIILKAN